MEKEKNINKKLVLDSENFNPDLYNGDNLIINIDLSKFKIKKCSTETKHDKNKCFYYHDKYDKRRPLNKNSVYSMKLCKKHISGKYCILKDKCVLSINYIEHAYNPEKYKKKYCKYSDNLTKCSLKEVCYDAHSDKEIRINWLHKYEKNIDFYLFKFKTEFCPYYNDGQHDVNICEYAHNFNEFRRDINIHPFSNYECGYWKPNKIKFYNQGCIYGVNCYLCHGDNEFNYHPLNFKRTKCSNSLDCQNIYCPFLHNNEESPFKQSEKLNSNFLIIAQNRLIPDKNNSSNNDNQGLN